MKKIVYVFAVIMFYVPSFDAFAAEKQAKRDPSAEKVNLPEKCLRVVQNVAAAAGGESLNNPASAFSVTAVRVTHVGPPPEPNEGGICHSHIKQPLSLQVMCKQQSVFA